MKETLFISSKLWLVNEPQSGNYLPSGGCREVETALETAQDHLGVAKG